MRLDTALRRLDVEVCPHGFRIERLIAPSPRAHALLEGGRIRTPQGDRVASADGVDLPPLRGGECLSYTVDLRNERSDRASLRWVGSDVLASPDLWLWAATPRPRAAPVRVHFTLPPGVQAAVPWQEARYGTESGKRIAGGGGTGAAAEEQEFLLPETAFVWKSAGAFSHRTPLSLSVPGTDLRFLSLGDGFGERERAVREWIEQGARVSSLLFGRFPVSRTLVLAVPDERSNPGFGMALRGGGAAVVIFLDRRARAESLADDWTSTHEFLHLGVPRLPPEDAWLFEGLATYYTEVMRARAGLINAREAYQHLLAGFERGRRGKSALSLREESSRMRERRSFVRVYWSGAALSFLTDVAARRAGGPTLDDALRSFAECCAASEEDWSAERVLAHLDRTLGAPRFAEQARRWLDSHEFPDLDSTLLTLGVSVGAARETSFQQAPEAALRDAIMAKTQTTNESPTEPQRQVQ